MNHKKAFTLLELSLALILITILLVAAIAGKRLVNQARVSQARIATDGSPAMGIAGLSIWLETTSTRSFLITDPEEGDKVTVWNNISKSIAAGRKATANVGNEPTYSETGIGGLPSILFDGVDDYFEFDGDIFVNGEYTIFIVEKATIEEDSDRYYIGGDAFTNSIVFGYLTTSNTIMQSVNLSSLEAPFNLLGSKTVPRITTLMLDNRVGKSIYVNGSIKAINSDTTATPSLLNGSAYVGKATNDDSQTFYYKGNIGEIIIYKRSLTRTERVLVERYLAIKWTIKLDE